MLLFICIGCRSTSCYLDLDLAYQYVHHQVLIQSNENICHYSIKLMDSWVISTIDCWRCVWDSSLNNIDILMKIWTCTVVLHWRNFKQMLWWTPIKFIWWENLLTLIELIVSMRVHHEPTSWSLHCNWYEQVFWCLNSQLPMWIVLITAYLNPKLLALVWVYQWFSILFPNHKPCPNYSITTYPESSVKAVTPVHIGTFICYEYSGRNGNTVQSSEVSDIGRNLAPKQWVSAWLPILVANALQVTLSWFLCTLLIIQRSPILMLNTALFKFSSGTRSPSQVYVTRFPR